MAMQADEIIQLIKQHIPDADVELKALIDDGDHYQATVTSSQFSGLSRVKQHKLVYEALGGRMGGQLHALSLTTKVKE